MPAGRYTPEQVKLRREHPRFRLLGWSVDVKKCEFCGRKTQEGTVRIASADNDERYYGADCAATALGYTNTERLRRRARAMEQKKDGAFPFKYRRSDINVEAERIGAEPAYTQKFNIFSLVDTERPLWKPERSEVKPEVIEQVARAEEITAEAPAGEPPPVEVVLAEEVVETPASVDLPPSIEQRVARASRVRKPVSRSVKPSASVGKKSSAAAAKKPKKPKAPKRVEVVETEREVAALSGSREEQVAELLRRAYDESGDIEPGGGWTSPGMVRKLKQYIDKAYGGKTRPEVIADEIREASEADLPELFD